MDTFSSTDRSVAIDAVDVLNDLVGDLIAGTRVLSDYHQDYRNRRIGEGQMSAVQKMCISHIALAFAKTLEFWERYHHVVPEDHRAQLKTLNAELERRGAKKFRDTVAGHIWDRKLQRPLRNSEIMEMLEALTEGKLGEFLGWVNCAATVPSGGTVVSLIEAVRDAIVVRHDILKHEVVER